MLTVISIVVAVLLGLLMYKTKYGKQLHAVGQKRVAAGYAGINTKRVVIIAVYAGRSALRTVGNSVRSV